LNTLGAVLDPFRHYAAFNGRTDRRSYWPFTVFNIVLGLIDLTFLNAIRDGINTNATANTALLIPVSLFTLYFIAAAIPSLSSQIRRLHDTGRSGWFALLNVVPLIGALLMLIFTLQDSQPGDNQWGANPRTTAESSIPNFGSGDR